ncbi:MAG: DUF5119 domain-containing protein [Bacteroides sp.]|nr:DUF5119 domain-containing protein [Bacteroides sp.]
MKRHLIYMMALCLLAVLATACEHKDLCYIHPHTANVRIDVDWSRFDKEVPTGMTLVLFPEGGGAPMVHLTNTITHASLKLAAGTYRVFVVNQSPSEFASFALQRFDNWADAEALGNECTSSWYAKGDDERLSLQPEWLAVDYLGGVEVTEQQVILCREAWLKDPLNVPEYLIATLYPRNVIYTVKVKLHVHGAYNLRSARATLSRMAEGHCLTAGRQHSTLATHLLENWQLQSDSDDPTKGLLTTTLTSFGLPYGHAGRAEENTLQLSALLVDNATVMNFPIQVGHRFTISEEAPMTLLVEIDTPITLPDVEPEGGSSGGFDAVVEDWGDEIDYIVPM